jgi:hypothetical protein
MDLRSQNDLAEPAPVSDRVLRSIVEQGFFCGLNRLADARSACAELLHARAVIANQAAKIARLEETEPA